MQQIAIRDSLQPLFREISRYPLLSREEERELALRYYEDKDMEAAKKLVTSNLRFVVKLAYEYEKYGFPLADLIQEGTLGLMKAVQKYDPYKGSRLITYAAWWIKAYINSYIMRSWSLVKIGTTQAQRKLFQKLSKKKNTLNIREGDLREDDIKKLAIAFDVTEGDVIDMEIRTVNRDVSLDKPYVEDSSASYMDFMESKDPTQEEVLEAVEADGLMREGLASGLEVLTPRERYIIERRFQDENPMKLRELGEELNISKERVRQVESGALLKLRAAIGDCLNPRDAHGDTYTTAHYA